MILGNISSKNTDNNRNGQAPTQQGGIMDRPIKFRAWADGKMWYLRDEYWWYFSSTGYWSLNHGDGPGEILCDSLESQNPHLLQFTGLLDRNGKEIYEGDIIKWQDDFGTEQYQNMRDITSEVTFEAGAFNPLSELIAFGSEFEIIGNIYEHKEIKL